MVLEASDYIGGRMKKFEFENMVLEQGANWIHGWENEKTGKKNPIAELAEKVDLSKNHEDE